jgi:hypothetical protein
MRRGTAAAHISPRDGDDGRPLHQRTLRERLMLANRRLSCSTSNVTKCHICDGRFERAGFVECPGCGKTFHEGCLEYHSGHECPDPANPDDLVVGAVEF